MKFSSITLAAAAAIISVVSFPSSAAAPSTRGGGAEAMESVSEKVVVDASPAVVDVAPKEENGRRLNGDIIDFNESISYGATTSYDWVIVGNSNIEVTSTEYKDSDGNKKACDVIVRMTTPNPDGVALPVTVRYDSNFIIGFRLPPTLIATSGSYKSEFFYMDESPPFGGNGKGNGSGGKVMRLKINGVDVLSSSFKDFLKFSQYGARKKQTVQLIIENKIFSQCEEAAAFLGNSWDTT